MLSSVALAVAEQVPAAERELVVEQAPVVEASVAEASVDAALAVVHPDEVASVRLDVEVLVHPVEVHPDLEVEAVRPARARVAGPLVRP